MTTGNVQIAEDADCGYYVKIKMPGQDRFWSKRYCFTLWGARRVARKIQARLDRGLYQEDVKPYFWNS